jgi:tRNA A-37 threonylcarbamoyl transferase component Bud32
MYTSAYERIRQQIEQNGKTLDALIRQSDKVKIYKKNHEKEIISFYFSDTHQRVILKLDVKGNKLQKFFRRWEKSLCKKEYAMALRFLERGFAVPGPIFCGERRQFGLLQMGYYLSCEIPDSVLFTDYLEQFDKNQKKEKIKEKREILQAIGKYIGTMHAQCMYHGILMPHHILLKKGSGTYQIYLIDLEYSRIYKKPKRKILFKELRKLNKYIQDYEKKGCLTRNDKFRFIREYCRANPQLRMADFTNGNFKLKSTRQGLEESAHTRWLLDKPLLISRWLGFVR